MLFFYAKIKKALSLWVDTKSTLFFNLVEVFNMSDDVEEAGPREEGTLGVYDPHTVRFIAAVCQNMPRLYRDTMLSWTNNPKKLQKALRDALMPSWEIVRLSKNYDGIDMSFYVKELIETIPEISEKDTLEVEVEIMEVRDLGFPKGAQYSDILKVLPEYDLRICRPAIGPHLTKKITKSCPQLYIFMKPLKAKGFEGIFTIDEVYKPPKGGCSSWLRAEPCDEMWFWKPDTTFVFERVR